MKQLIQKQIHSPVIMSWMSLTSKAGNLLLITPLALYYLTPLEFAMWQSVVLINGYALVADFGFSATYSRMISYLVPRFSEERKSNGQEGFLVLRKLMKKTYGFSSLVVLVLVSILFAVLNNNNRYSDSTVSWGWIIAFTLLCNSFVVYFKQYNSILIGFNLLAQVKRVETIFNVLSTVMQASMLYFFRSVEGVIGVQLVFLMLNGVRDFVLFQSWRRKVVFEVHADHVVHGKEVVKDAMKMGVSSLFSLGVFNFFVLYVSSLMVAVESAMLLLNFRIFNQIRDFSIAPLYAKLPRLYQLHSKGEETTLRNEIHRGLYTSLLLFVGFSLGMYLLGTIASQWYGFSFPAWQGYALVFGLYFFQRIGGSHLQILSVYNSIQNHWVDAASGLLIVILYSVIPMENLTLRITLSMLISYGIVQLYFPVNWTLNKMGEHFWPKHGKMYLVLTLAIFVSGLISYFISQWKF